MARAQDLWRMTGLQSCKESLPNESCSRSSSEGGGNAGVRTLLRSHNANFGRGKGMDRTNVYAIEMARLDE